MDERNPVPDIHVVEAPLIPILETRKLRQEALSHSKRRSWDVTQGSVSILKTRLQTTQGIVADSHRGSPGSEGSLASLQPL